MLQMKRLRLVLDERIEIHRTIGHHRIQQQFSAAVIEREDEPKSTFEYAGAFQHLVNTQSHDEREAPQPLACLLVTAKLCAVHIDFRSAFLEELHCSPPARIHSAIAT